MERSRRKVLGMCVLASVSLTGCLSEESPSDPSRIGSVVVYNFDRESHIVHVTVRSSDENVIYENSVSIAAGDPQDPNVLVIEDFPNNPQEGTLLVQVGEPSEGEQVTKALKFELECVELNIHLGNYNKANKKPSIFAGRCI